MEQIEEQRAGRSGISNYYYGQVNKVINLKLSAEQLKAMAAEKTIFNGTVGQVIDNVKNLF